VQRNDVHSAVHDTAECVGGAADGPAGVRGGPCSAGPAACPAADGQPDPADSATGSSPPPAHWPPQRDSHPVRRPGSRTGPDSHSQARHPHRGEAAGEGAQMAASAIQAVRREAQVWIRGHSEGGHAAGAHPEDHSGSRRHDSFNSCSCSPSVRLFA